MVPPPMIALPPPGPELRLERLLLDVNGTLTDRGRLIEGVAERIGRLREVLEVSLLTADTYGTAAEVAGALGVSWQVVVDGDDKVRVAERTGADAAAAIGNGTNDAGLLACVALGIAVTGPEGTSLAAMRAADVACRSIAEALELLLDPVALVATLRR